MPSPQDHKSSGSGVVLRYTSPCPPRQRSLGGSALQFEIWFNAPLPSTDDWGPFTAIRRIHNATTVTPGLGLSRAPIGGTSRSDWSRLSSPLHSSEKSPDFGPTFASGLAPLAGPYSRLGVVVDCDSPPRWADLDCRDAAGSCESFPEDFPSLSSGSQHPSLPHRSVKIG